MQQTIDRVKKLKDITQEEVTKVMKEQAYKSVFKELKEDGIDVKDLSEEEFNQLMKEEIKKQKTFSKGVLVGGSALLFLELLG